MKHHQPINYSCERVLVVMFKVVRQGATLLCSEVWYAEAN